MPAFHQFVAGFTNGDAISNEALVIRQCLRAWGCESEIFSEARRILPELRRHAGDVSDYAAVCRAGDAVLLHFSIGSPVNEVFARLPCRKALLYHNVTPAAYYRLVNERAAYDLALGRRQIAQLAGTAAVTLADSRYNAAELEALGFREVRVLPLILDLGRLRRAADRAVLRALGRHRLTTVLFVGRCAPNKKIEDALRAFYYFQKYVEPGSRFIHAGSYAGTEYYRNLLLGTVRSLAMRHVHFTGSIPQSELNAYYARADLFLCMSEHEGFCIPLLESMVHDVPILAYAAAAVPETLDGCGVLVREKTYDLIAEMMGHLARRTALRQAVIRGQRERLARYEARDLAGELRAHLAPLLGNP